jgi:hypothetical protein
MKIATCVLLAATRQGGRAWARTAALVTLLAVESIITGSPDAVPYPSAGTQGEGT